MSSLLQAKPHLTAALSFLAFGASACRNIIESSEGAPGPPQRTDKSALLSEWPGSNGIKRETQKTHWVTSLVALQVDVPVAQLVRCGISEVGDAYDLARNLFSAFLDARARGLEAWFLDKDVPQLSFTPWSLLFGRSHSAGAFMLGHWSSARRIQLDQPILHSETANPICEFRPSKAMITASNINAETDAAGTVLYWKFPRRSVDQVDKAASYGIPWRLMEGAFQEFIVEKITSETTKVTYVTVGCGNMYPGGQRERTSKGAVVVV